MVGRGVPGTPTLQVQRESEKLRAPILMELVMELLLGAPPILGTHVLPAAELRVSNDPALGSNSAHRVSESSLLTAKGQWDQNQPFFPSYIFGGVHLQIPGWESWAVLPSSCSLT